MKKENLEDIFKRELQDFEAAPPEHLWEGIAKEIDPKKNRKKVFPFWYLGSGIAASLALFYVFIFNSSSNDNTIENVVTNEIIEYCPEGEALVKSTITPKIDNQNVQKEKAVQKNTVTALPTSENEFYENNSNSSKNNNNKQTAKKVFATTALTAIKNETDKKNYNSKNKTQNNYSKSEYTPNQNKESENTGIASSKPKTNKSIIIAKKPYKSEPLKNNLILKESFNDENQLSDTELKTLLFEEKETEEPTNNIGKKWSIQPQLGTYSYSSIVGGSTINPDFNSNPQFTETDLSYGIRIAYQASPKIKIRGGVTNTSIDITTSLTGSENQQDVQAISEFTLIDDFVDEFTDNADEEIFIEDPGVDSLIDPPSNPGTDEAPTSEATGNITQKLQYIEFPIEASYNIINKKIGLDIITGFSTFLLSNNQTTFENVNRRISLGETTTLNTTSFSGNIGFSVSHSILKNLSLNLEPMVKFQFNSFDERVDYQPILVGLSSGVIWKF